MISTFTVTGYKCLTGHRLELAPMTVLCGVNGAGKSSFVQAILLAHLASSGTGSVALNGPLDLHLGQALDVLRAPTMGVSAEGSWGSAHWRFSADTDDALALRVDERPDQAPTGIQQLLYLEAERLGPRDLQPLESVPSDTVNLGVKGEYVAQVLELRGGRLPVRESVCHPGRNGDVAPPILPKQVEAWLQELVPGIELRAQAFPNLSAATVRLRRTGQATEWLRPQNIGFGVSYALPIVVAGLVASPGSMILIENPEAHLHPKAQSGVAQFLAGVAASGVQVVVETHSDHFLNGLRVAAVSGSPLRPEDIAVQFFSCTDDGVAVQRIGISARGSLTAAPADFFDQSEKDLAAILKARRRG